MICEKATKNCGFCRHGRPHPEGKGCVNSRCTMAGYVTCVPTNVAAGKALVEAVTGKKAKVVKHS